ncbi:MAG TPA: hypothetical protein VFX70_07945, partial [Mycobacteriales bacterium]|nr:hypothetical protein [Mycobacteriales bacterium]
LADVAGAVARIDPGRAERIARSVTDSPSQAQALADVAAAVAGTDPDRAEWLARSISDPHWRARAFSGVAGAVVRADPDRARRLAADVLSTGNWLEVLGVVARLDHPAFVLICDHALHVLTLRADPL